MSRAHSFLWQNLTNSVENLVNSAAHRGNTGEISAVWLNHELISEIHVRNLWIFHYSLNNFHFHQPTITIKPKINVYKLITELLWGYFLPKKLFERKTSNSAGKMPNSAARFHGKNPNSATWLEIPRSPENSGPYLWGSLQLTLKFYCILVPSLLSHYSLWLGATWLWLWHTLLWLSLGVLLVCPAGICWLSPIDPTFFSMSFHQSCDHLKISIFVSGDYYFQHKAKPVVLKACVENISDFMITKDRSALIAYYCCGNMVLSCSCCNCFNLCQAALNPTLRNCITPFLVWQ